MRHGFGKKQLIWGWLSAASILVVSLPILVRAESVERTTLHVVVKDSETEKPINQAKLTLQFREPGNKSNLKRSKVVAYSAKTNAQGQCRFVFIPKGSIHLIVTAERHQTFGEEYDLDQDNQVIEVKLKRPQPLL